MKTRFLIILSIGLVGFVGIPNSDAFNGGGIVIEVPGQTMDISQNIISPGETMFVNGSFKQPAGDFSTNIFKNYEDSRKLVLTLNPPTNEFGDFNFNFTIPEYWELGNYYMILENGLQSMDWNFVVRKNYVGAALDPTVYPIQQEILSPLKQFKLGVPVDQIQCNDSLVLVTKNNGSPACIKPETKIKLIERGWAYNMFTNLTLHNTQSWGYIKEISILDSHYVGITMSYPTNEAYHEISPDEYNFIIGNCDLQNDSARLSILYLKDVNPDADTITFTKEKEIFVDMTCNDAFWGKMKQSGYCGPPTNFSHFAETLTSSIDDAQKSVDFVLDVPKYLPAGYDIQKIMVDSDRKHATLFISPLPVTNETNICKFAWDNEGIYLSYVSIPDDVPRFANDPDKERITINGNRGYVEHRWVGDRFGTPIPQSSEITWHMPENNLILDMSSSLPSEELIKIAESIE